MVDPTPCESPKPPSKRLNSESQPLHLSLELAASGIHLESFQGINIAKIRPNELPKVGELLGSKETGSKA
jgi:hypothetical protein